MSSRASNSSESDLMTSDEWTVVTHQEGEGTEKQTVISARRKSTQDDNKDEKERASPDTESHSSSSLGSEWDPMKEDKVDEDVMSNGSSDIAVLGEDEDDEKVKEKPATPDVPLGLTRVEELRDDMSDISSVRDEINSEVDFSPSSFRHYVHVPNNRVNLTLTVVAVLAVTAVLGLGIGNFIGWSCMQRMVLPSGHQQKRHEKFHHRAPEERFNERDLLKQARYLQKQLAMCNKQPNNKACLKDAEVWRRQFVDLIASKGGERILKELQKETESSPQQQQQLRVLEDKLSLLSKQIENLQIQKSPEPSQEGKLDSTQGQKPVDAVKEPERVDSSLYIALNEQVQLLKDQNQELHGMLQSLQSKDRGQDKPELLKLREEVEQAVQENSRLRAMMDDIKVNREMGIRQQINDLQLENQDLRVEIGRLRYSQSKQQEVPVEAAEAEEKEEEDQGPIKGLLSKWPEVNWTELVNHLGSTGQGKKLEELGESLSQLLRDLWELNATLFPSREEDAARAEDDTLKEIETLLVKKWKELQGMLSLSKGYVSRHAEGMTRLLTTSMSKVYKTGVKVLFGDPHKESPSISSLQPQLKKIMSKMGKVMTSLEEKWSKMKRRLSSEQQYLKPEEEDEAEEVLVEEEEERDVDGQWVFQRAKDRGQNREITDSKFYEDWYTLRAKNRKRQREEQGKNCGKKCKKNLKRQSPLAEESSDDSWENDLPKHTFKESRGY